jgi:chromate transporter
MQLATYLGWLLHGLGGGLVAGALFVLSGFVAILALSTLYASFQGIGVVTALFFGLKAAVLAVVVEAVIRIGRRVLKNGAMIGIPALAFIGIVFFELPVRSSSCPRARLACISVPDLAFAAGSFTCPVRR